MKKLNILILGKGKIGKAVEFFLKKNKATKKVGFFSNEKDLKKCDILIGCLPGKIGERGLNLALKYKKNFFDISDVELDFYFKKKEKIQKKKILVIPGCGFFPGILNFILSFELSHNKFFENVEIEAGTISPKSFFFPFLWSFEDLILEHESVSWQVINGKKRKFSPFSDYEKKVFFGIKAESYLAPGEVGYFLKNFQFKNFKVRVIRPFGFFYFFKFFKNFGFLEKKNLKFSQKILQSNKEDNLTLGVITLSNKKEKVKWIVKAFSKKDENLNSMQKITASFVCCLVELFFENKIEKRELTLVEEMAKEKNFFEKVLKKLKKYPLTLKKI